MIFASWVRVQFLATFFLHLITVVDGRMAFRHPDWSTSITSQTGMHRPEIMALYYKQFVNEGF